MAYDPMEGFQIGQAVGKARRSSLGRTTDYMSELFKKRDEESSDIGGKLGLEMLKSSITSPKEQATTEFLKTKTAKLKDPSQNLSVSQQIRKDKRVEDLFSKIETNKVKKDAIDKAVKSLPSLPGGIMGKVQVGAMKMVDPNNPILGDWQNLKSVLMDATLMNIGKTKGAISDKEMKEFQTAAANDDLVSVSRMGNALERLRDSMEADERASMASYQTIYGENPNDFLGSADEFSEDDPGGLFS